jgi:hypothetical protein
MKDGVGGHRSLMSITGILIQFSGLDKIGPIVATTRAAEAIGPFAPDEIPQTIALCAKPPTELPGLHRRIHSSPPLYNGLWSNNYTKGAR